MEITALPQSRWASCLIVLRPHFLTFVDMPNFLFSFISALLFFFHAVFPDPERSNQQSYFYDPLYELLCLPFSLFEIFLLIYDSYTRGFIVKFPCIHIFYLSLVYLLHYFPSSSTPLLKLLQQVSVLHIHTNIGNTSTIVTHAYFPYFSVHCWDCLKSGPVSCSLFYPLLFTKYA